jgi:hypothetical protein
VKFAVLPLFALTAGFVSAAGPATDPAAGEEKTTGFLDGTLLPDGSILENVTLPNYDEKLHLTSSLHAKQLIIHKRQTDIEAILMIIDFFSTEKKQTGSLQLLGANFDPSSGILRSNKSFNLVSDRLDATGTALVYDVNLQRGYLTGPVTADAVLQKAIAMKTPPTLNPLAIGAALVAAAAFADAAPAKAHPADKPRTAQEERSLDERSKVSGQALLDKGRLTPDELHDISQQAQSARPLAENAKEPAAASLKQAETDHFMVHDALAEFAVKVALTTLVTTAKDPATETGDVPPPPPLDGPKTHITADEGAFIDREKGILVFMKNVVVKDESTLGNMTGADELKVLFKPMPPKPDPKDKDSKASDQGGQTPSPDGGKSTPKDTPPVPTQAQLDAMKEAKAAKALSDKAANPDKKPANSDLGGSGMGELQRIIATGKAVLLTKKAPNPEDPDMQACGHIVIYEPDKHEMVIKGGSPWLVTKGKLLKVQGDSGYIRYNTITGEGLATGGALGFDLKSDNPKPDKPAKDKDKKPDKTTPPAKPGH